VKITAEILESYLSCPYKGYLNLAGERGIMSDYGLMLKESRVEMRAAATTKLLHANQSASIQNVALKFEVLTGGVSLVLDATREDEQLKICFDGLQRSNGASQLGDFHYIPILVHEGERPGKAQKVLLELLALVLAAVQGKEPQWGILIHGQACATHKVKLGTHAAYAQLTLQQIKELQETGKPPKFRLNRHCSICEFRQRCHAEALGKDDLSLLSGISDKEVAKFNRKGIFTVTQLSYTFRPKKSVRASKRKVHPHQRALQALAIRDKKIYVLGSPKLPDAAVRIFLDVEGDPERGYDYLVGLIVQATGPEKCYSFWADSPADEAHIFDQFLGVVTEHADFYLFSYGSYDLTFLRRMMKLSEQEEVVKNILVRYVNILSVIRAHIYFPTHSNSLKEISRYLGFDWTDPDASGIQSIVWRRQWEHTRSADPKGRLITYNSEDCVALKKVAQFIYAICPSLVSALGTGTLANIDSHQVCRQVEQMDPQFNRREWCRATFAIENFEFVNERAYFDYQRDKVFIRTNHFGKRSVALRNTKRVKTKLLYNRHVEIACQKCPTCESELATKPDRRLARLGYDLVFSPGGVKRRITRYTTSWHQCLSCESRFLPQEYLRLDEHCHSLKSWAINMHVAHRMTFNSIAETLYDCFKLPLHTSSIWTWKAGMARYYEPTYRRLMERIVAGPLIHADETNVCLTRAGRGYVWVFASLDEVVFVYRQTREGGFLPEVFKGFSGVLVSDFYAAYDAIECEQQKCLIHLIRDFNDDLLQSPWDEELKDLGSRFGILLRTIIATVDRYGLKRYHLRKHQHDVERFYRNISRQPAGQSELAAGYRRRLIKYRNRLFTFLDYDNVPWNNNNAEHAVKRFAKYRALVDGRYGQAGLNQYLILLSIYVTCEFKGVDFLRFLLSRETDINKFALNISNVVPSPTIEVYPDSVQCGTRGRKRTWDRQILRQQCGATAMTPSSAVHPNTGDLKEWLEP
jgi:predicted RecB family nuclease